MPGSEANRLAAIAARSAHDSEASPVDGNLVMAIVPRRSVAG
jgi:hypothetical protein